MLDFKTTLHQACLQRVDQNIALAIKAMDDAQNAANQETKSSVGDKYETGRAMMQLEKEKYTQQLAQAQDLRQQLEWLKPEQTSTQIQMGSLIRSNEGFYYLSVSLGKLTHQEQTVFVLSGASPLGQVLFGKKTGEKLVFQGRIINILEIF